MQRKLFLVTLVTALFYSINCNAAEKIFLGVLEPYTDTSWEKEVESDWARLPFFWDGKNWATMPEYQDESFNEQKQNEVAKLYPEHVKFYAGRADKEGHQVYTLINTDIAKFNVDNGMNGSEAPSYLIKALDPSLVNYMAQDDYYCQLRESCKKPMILTTAQNQLKEDREGWQEEAELKPEEKKLIYAAFRKQTPTYNFCQDGSQDNAKEKKWKDDEVNQIKIYRNKNQDLLVGLQLNKDLDSCQFWYDDPFEAHWFYAKKTEINFLGQSIMPIEYADYNNDGKTEWIFGLYGDNNDGYILFTDGFKNKLVYDWRYH